MSTSAPEQVRRLLSVQDVHADVAGQPVLRGASLDVAEGEFVVVLGHNGAGKSTLLRTLLGLVPVKRGSVRLADEETTRRDTPFIVSSGVALVPQQRGYFENLSVEDNLSFGESRSGQITREQIFDLFPPLHERRQQLVGSMSGGQRQMVAISIALMSNPRLLMLDEPSVGLQPNLVDRVMQVTRQINEEFGITVLLVEQNIEKVLHVAHRVVVINRGQILLDRPVDQITPDDVWALL